jgi:hypothetical protein
MAVDEEQEVRLKSNRKKRGTHIKRLLTLVR